MGEFLHRIKRLGEGRELKRTGIGSDYSYDKNWLTGKKLPFTFDEVKTFNAKLSKRQKNTQKKSSRYNVERYRL